MKPSVPVLIGLLTLVYAPAVHAAGENEVAELDAAGDSTALDEDEPPANPDEIVLKNGGFVRGMVTEDNPDGAVVIIDSKGETRTFQREDVERVDRGKYTETDSSRGGKGSEAERGDSPEERSVGRPGDPFIHIELENPDRGPATLHYIAADFYFQTADGTGVITAQQDLCTSPCNVAYLEAGGKQFYIRANGVGSRRFTIPADASEVDLNVKAGSRGMLWGGFGLVAGGGLSLATGASLLLVQAILASADASGAIGSGSLIAGGTLTGLGVAMIGGGVPLLVFGRTRVELAVTR